MTLGAAGGQCWDQGLTGVEALGLGLGLVCPLQPPHWLLGVQ